MEQEKVSQVPMPTLQTSLFCSWVKDCSFAQVLHSSGSLRQGRCPPSLSRGYHCCSCG